MKYDKRNLQAKKIPETLTKNSRIIEAINLKQIKGMETFKTSRMKVGWVMSVFAAAIRSNQIISISPIHNDSEFDESPVSGYEVVR